MQDLKPKAWIVSAAIRNKDAIITGARHFDSIMHEQIRHYTHATACQSNVPSYAIKWEQGFIDQYGAFYSREDALQIVKENGQPFNAERNSGAGDELYSEGLY